MTNHSNRPPESLEPAGSKILQSMDEMAVFYQFLSDKVTSCTDAAKMLNIPQKHLTWYKRELEELGKLQVVKIGKCPHTRRFVQFITTNPAQFTQPSQLQITFLEP